MHDTELARRPKLDICLGERVERPSAGYNLLVGFHFGRRHADAGRPEVVSLDLSPLEGKHLFETWWYKGGVERDVRAGVRIMECEDYAIAIAVTEDKGDDDFQRASRETYEKLISAVQSTTHNQIVKVWNYIGGINSGRDDMERYRQFSVGRAKAFRAFGIEDENAPTGTAIGTSRERGLTLIALASRRPFVPTENPRQVSAFQYPRQYGPCSPKFSRAGCVTSRTHRLFLISGTAAVVGHESAYPYDISLQTDETFRNLDTLRTVLSEHDPTGPPVTLLGRSAIRVYLRNPADLALVTGKLKDALRSEKLQAAFLQGHICRRELVVEIDGVEVGELGISA